MSNKMIDSVNAAAASTAAAAVKVMRLSDYYESEAQRIKHRPSAVSNHRAYDILRYHPSCDPYRLDRMRRREQARREEGRWDGCSDPNRKAAVAGYNAGLATEVVLGDNVYSYSVENISTFDEKEAARLRKNARERARRAAKRAEKEVKA